MNHRLASLLASVYFTMQKKVEPVLLIKRGTRKNVSHLFQSTLASMFMLRQGARNSSDGAVIVHCLPTAAASTFHEYVDKVFIPYLEKQLQESRRLDIVWDTYISDSLKKSTRVKRGKGVRRKVSGQTRLPGNWMNFLHDSTNKKELCAFLTTKVEQFNCPASTAMYAPSGQSVLSISSGSPMQSCNHEEADTRVVVHILHALEHGERTVLVRTVDTDVVVILVGTFHNLAAVQPLLDIWVGFGTGKNYRFYNINAICASLGEPWSQALQCL